MPLFGSRGAASVTGFGGLAKLGYLLRNSLRFRASNSAYLSRTGGTPSNGKTATYSFWMKRGTLSSGTHWLFTGGTTVSLIGFNAGADTLSVFGSDGSAEGNITTAVFRDPAAWYHVVIRINTTEGSAADRAKIYVNGVQQAVSVNNSGIVLDSNWGFNTAGSLAIGRYNPTTSGYSDVYLAEVHFIDGGTPPLPSSFAKTDPATGQWIPIKYAGTYGNNGFYLPFTNTTSTSTLGNDFSGRGNNWTVNNISLTAGATYDSMTDVPTLTSTTAANYCVMNPLNTYSSITVSNANLTLALTEAAYRKSVATMAFPITGKYYVEANLTGGTDYVSFGIVTPTAPLSDAVGVTATGYGVITSSVSWDKKNNGVSSGNFWTLSLPSTATLQIAVDTTSGKLWVGYNNTWLDSSGGTTGNPSAGTNETFTIDTTRIYLPSFGGYKVSSIVLNTNFGQRPFTLTAPTNFVALNTFNL